MLETLENFLQLSFTGSYIVSRYRQICGCQKKQAFLFLIALDFAIGIAISRLVSSQWPPSQIVKDALVLMEIVVVTLRDLIVKLMDAPAGLKLNSVLSKALGKFFLYHIHLWATFLQLTAPFVTQLLEEMMTVISYLGICLQLSVAQDTLNVITFHVHCFFAYARRLFLSQTSGLVSLWRLFRGKKYNPLRKRVDSSHLTIDQLFVGTLAFTILLFLYPTTLTYFVVFKALDLTILAVNMVLSKIIVVIAQLSNDRLAEIS